MCVGGQKTPTVYIALTDEHEEHLYTSDMLYLGLKTLSLNLALTLGCLNPKNLNPNPDPNSNPYPNNCGYESN